MNGKIYIGVHSTSKIEDGYLGTGRAFRLARKKYGDENFLRTILAFHDTRESANKHEAEMVDLEFVNRKDTYNMKTGGENGFHGEETKVKISRSTSGRSRPDMIGKKPWNFGRFGYTMKKRGPLSEETRRKISETKKSNPISRQHSEESKAKMSLAARGKTSSFKGRSHTPVAKLKCPNLERDGQN